MTRAIRLPDAKRVAQAVFPAAISAALLTLAYPPLSGWPLSYMALVPLVRGVATHRHAFGPVLLAGVTFGGLWFLGTQHWIFQVHGPGLLSTSLPWPGLLACSVFALFGMIVTIALSLLIRLHLPAAGALPISWCIAEAVADTVLRNMIGTTFDCHSLAVTQQAPSPLACLAAAGGLPLVSAAVCCVNGFADDLLCHRKLALAPMSLLGLACVLSHVSSSGASGNEHRDESHRVSVLMCSTRLPVASDALEQLRLAAREADLVVFPEMAVDGVSDDRSPPEAAVYAAAWIDRPIAVPCVRINEEGTSLISALLVIHPDGHSEVLANKRFPGPFQECETPLENALRLWLGMTFPREGETPILHEPVRDVVRVKGLQAGAGICHDVCFPEWSREEARRGCDLLIVSANCAFDSTGTIGARILSCARLRAIESGSPLLLCALGVPSAAYDGNGRPLVGTETGNAHWTLIGLVAMPREIRAGTLQRKRRPECSEKGIRA